MSRLLSFWGGRKNFRWREVGGAFVKRLRGAEGEMELD